MRGSRECELRMVIVFKLGEMSESEVLKDMVLCKDLKIGLASPIDWSHSKNRSIYLSMINSNWRFRGFWQLSQMVFFWA